MNLVNFLYTAKSIFLKILKHYKSCKIFIMKQRKKDRT